MILKVQILSFLFCFIYGVFYYLFFRVSRMYLVFGKILNKLFYNFLFMVINVFLFFILLIMFNNGILHLYFFFFFFFGFIIGHWLFTFIKCKIK